MATKNSIDQARCLSSLSKKTFFSLLNTLCKHPFDNAPLFFPRVKVGYCEMDSSWIKRLALNRWENSDEIFLRIDCTVILDPFAESKCYRHLLSVVFFCFKLFIWVVHTLLAFCVCLLHYFCGWITQIKKKNNTNQCKVWKSFTEYQLLNSCQLINVVFENARTQQGNYNTYVWYRLPLIISRLFDRRNITRANFSIGAQFYENKSPVTGYAT